MNNIGNIELSRTDAFEFTIDWLVFLFVKLTFEMLVVHG